MIREPAKCSAIGWFAPGTVPAELTVISRENLANYREKYPAPPVPLSTGVERGDEGAGS